MIQLRHFVVPCPQEQRTRGRSTPVANPPLVCTKRRKLHHPRTQHPAQRIARRFVHTGAPSRLPRARTPRRAQEQATLHASSCWHTKRHPPSHLQLPKPGATHPAAIRAHPTQRHIDPPAMPAPHRALRRRFPHVEMRMDACIVDRRLPVSAGARSGRHRRRDSLSFVCRPSQ